MENIKIIHTLMSNILSFLRISQIVQFLCAALVNNYIDKKITSD